MKFRNIFAFAGALLVLVFALSTSAVAAGGTSVAVRVEGKTRTLLAPTVVNTHAGWITAGHVARGKCSATSGQGALDVATHHRWAGTFSSSLGSYFIKKILGETDNGPKYYWSIFINNRSASTGACQIKLHRHDQLLFAAATYPEYPISIQAPESATAGRHFRVTVVGFNAAGKRKPLAGATVTGSGVSVTTGSTGIAQVTAGHAGKLALRAAAKGYIRSAPFTVHVTS